MNSADVSTLMLGDRLGKGGFGSVYAVNGYRLPETAGELVFKRYSRQALASYGGALRFTLDSLISTRTKMTVDERKQLDARTIWPLEVVTEGTEVVGFLMRKLPERFFFDLPKFRGGTDRKPREVQHYFTSEAETRIKGLPDMDLASRAYLLSRFVHQLEFLHDKQIIVGDIQGSNVVVDVVANDPAKTSLCIYDLDSCRMVGERPAIPQANAYAWEAPETLNFKKMSKQYQRGSREYTKFSNQASALTKQTDVYKTCLFALRLFAMTAGVSVSRDPAIANTTLRSAFGRGSSVFLQGLSEQPKDRPTAAELFKACVGG